MRSTHDGTEEIAEVLALLDHLTDHREPDRLGGSGDEVRVRSKGLGLPAAGTVVSAVSTDAVRRTGGGWRMSRHVIHVN